MSEFFSVGGGSSSISLARTSKGEYTYEIKLYFQGNSMSQIRQAIENVCKSRGILEHVLGQKVIPNEQMSATLRKLEAAVETATRGKGGEDRDGE